MWSLTAVLLLLSREALDAGNQIRELRLGELRRVDVRQQGGEGGLRLVNLHRARPRGLLAAALEQLLDFEQLLPLLAAGIEAGLRLHDALLRLNVADGLLERHLVGGQRVELLVRVVEARTPRSAHAGVLRKAKHVAQYALCDRGSQEVAEVVGSHCLALAAATLALLALQHLLASGVAQLQEELRVLVADVDRQRLADESVKLVVVLQRRLQRLVVDRVGASHTDKLIRVGACELRELCSARQAAGAGLLGRVGGGREQGVDVSHGGSLLASARMRGARVARGAAVPLLWEVVFASLDYYITTPRRGCTPLFRIADRKLQIVEEVRAAGYSVRSNCGNATTAIAAHCSV